MLRKGDMVMLYSEKERHVIEVKDGLIKFRGGAIKGDTLKKHDYGEPLEMPDGNIFWLLRPTPRDIITSLRRKAQIIRPKDAAVLIFYSGLQPGDTAVEAGVGSGGMTAAILTAIGPEGKLVSIDRNPDFIKVARRNIEPLFYERDWVIYQADMVEDDIDAKSLEIDGADVVILDLPTPWETYHNVNNILRPGGTLGVYVPTYNQLEKAWDAMDGYVDIFALEVSDRGIEKVEYDGGTALRPANSKVGFTAFLLFARKISQELL